MNCECYKIRNGQPVCLGTKEKDPCSCEGHRSKCSFYQEVRGSEIQTPAARARETVNECLSQNTHYEAPYLGEEEARAIKEILDRDRVMIPKNVNFIAYDVVAITCPICGEIQMGRNINFCTRCGQRVGIAKKPDGK